MGRRRLGEPADTSACDPAASVVLVDVTVQVPTREQQVSLIQTFEQMESQLPHAVNNSQGAEVPRTSLNPREPPPPA